MADRKVGLLTKQEKISPENAVMTEVPIKNVDLNSELLDKYRDVEEGTVDVRKGEGLSLEIAVKRYATQARNFLAITKARVDSLRTSPTADLSIEGLSYIEPSATLGVEEVAEEIDEAIQEATGPEVEPEMAEGEEPEPEDRIKAFIQRSGTPSLAVEEMQVDDRMQNLTEAEAQMLRILLGKLSSEPEKPEQPDINNNVDKPEKETNIDVKNKDKGDGDER